MEDSLRVPQMAPVGTGKGEGAFFATAFYLPPSPTPYCLLPTAYCPLRTEKPLHARPKRDIIPAVPAPGLLTVVFLQPAAPPAWSSQHRVRNPLALMTTP